jgi:hypothetical protein
LYFYEYNDYERTAAKKQSRLAGASINKARRIRREETPPSAVHKHKTAHSPAPAAYRKAAIPFEHA